MPKLWLYQRVVLLAGLVAVVSSGCKVARRSFDQGLGQEAKQATEKPGERQIKLRVAEQVEVLDLKPASPNVSPLFFVNVTEFERLKDEGVDVVEFSDDGKLVSIVEGTTSAVPPCYFVGIISVLVNIYSSRPLLITAYNDDPFARGDQISQFKLCHGAVVVDSRDEANEIKKFLIDRQRLPAPDAAFENASFGLAGAGSSIAAAASKSDLPDRSVTAKYVSGEFSQRHSEAPEAFEPVKEPAPTPKALDTSKGEVESPSRFGNGSDLAASGRKSPYLAIPQAFAAFAELHRGPLEHLGSLRGNAEEFALFRDSILPKMVTKEELGRGSYAKVKKVTIDGEDFAMRIETLGHHLPRDEALANRINFLVQNRFVEEYSHLPFARTLTSFINDRWEFITIVSLIKGGDMDKALKKGETDLPIRQGWLQAVTAQVQAYRNGVPITLKDVSGVEQKYTLEFQHGDLKPANFMIGDKGEVSIVDFGFSRSILRRTLPSGETEYKTFVINAGEPQLRNLKLLGSNKVYGTPVYFSPEMMSKDALDVRGVYAFLRDNDAHALNASAYEIKTGNKYIIDSFREARADNNAPLTRKSDLIAHLSAELAGSKRKTPAGMRAILPWEEIDMAAVRMAVIIRRLYLLLG